MLSKLIETYKQSIPNKVSESNQVPYTNKLIDYTYSSILYENNKYHKIERDVKSIYADIDDMVENDLANIPFLRWDKIPICFKCKYIKEFISKDNVLSEQKKQFYISHSTALIPLVSYNNKEGRIQQINFNKFKDS